MELLAELRQGRTVSTLQSEGRRRLDRFMPMLLEALSGEDTPSLTLDRSLALVESVLRRSAYLLLLTENRGRFASWSSSVAPAPGLRISWRKPRCCSMNCSMRKACIRRPERISFMMT